MELKKLDDVFPQEDLEWRLQSCGESDGGKIWAIALCYVTNRAIQKRLDDVCGKEGWRNEFSKAPDGGVLCGISVKVADEWIPKFDGAGNTDIESVKGGLSDSMKRAAVQWGIGRYLYKLDADFADIKDGGRFSGKTKAGKRFKWNPPRLPSWAIKSDDKTASIHAAPENGDKDDVSYSGDVVSDMQAAKSKADLQAIWKKMSPGQQVEYRGELDTNLERVK